MPADIWTSEDGERFLAVGSDDDGKLEVLVGAKYVGCIHFTPTEASQLASAILRQEPEHEAPIAGAGKLAEMLRLILPLAKGYALEHNVGSNLDYVRAAEGWLAEWEAGWNVREPQKAIGSYGRQACPECASNVPLTLKPGRLVLRDHADPRYSGDACAGSGFDAKEVSGD